MKNLSKNALYEEEFKWKRWSFDHEMKSLNKMLILWFGCSQGNFCGTPFPELSWTRLGGTQLNSVTEYKQDKFLKLWTLLKWVQRINNSKETSMEAYQENN